MSALLQLNSDPTLSIGLWSQISKEAGIFPLGARAEIFKDRHSAPLHPYSEKKTPALRLLSFFSLEQLSLST